MKLFISQPMGGKTDEEIFAEREKAIEIVKNKFDTEEIELIDSFIEDVPEVKNTPLFYLGKSLELLSDADVAYFVSGWQDARGCRIEHTCAVEYGIDCIE